MATDATAHADHQPHINSMAIFIALCVCTLLSVVFDIVPLNRQLVAILVLAVAVAKAQFVMRYFMHLKFEGRWKFVLLLPTAILACGLPLALAPDIALHYYTPETPEVRALDYAHETGHEAVELEEHQPVADDHGRAPAHELTPDATTGADGVGEE